MVLAIFETSNSKKSKKTLSDSNIAYSFDMVTNSGTRIRTQTYILPEKDKKLVSEFEAKISAILSDNINAENIE